MDKKKLHRLAKTIAALCPMHVENIVGHLMILKSNNLPYKLLLDFTDNIPLILIDIESATLPVEVEDQVARVLVVFNLFTVPEIKFR